MTRSLDETRRDFLVRLAKGAAFVPPALFTVDVSRVAAQGGGGGKGGKTATTTSSVVGTLTPTAPAAVQQQLQIDMQSTQSVPWDPGSAESPPWSAPPPTSTGG